jgi:hypothetical protein
MATTEGNGDAGFRITTGVLYTKIESLEKEVAELKTELKVSNTTMLAAIAGMTENAARLDKLEGRMNGVFVGIGSGILVAVMAVFRGVIGG